MPISDAKRKANKKWNDINLKERYDRIQLVVPIGRKDAIKLCADSKGLSLNAYIIQLIEKDMQQS